MTLVIRKRDMPFLLSRPKPKRRYGGGGAGRGDGFRASGGSFVLSGVDVDLRWFHLAVGAGAFVFTGNDAALNIGPVMVGGAGAFVMTGQDTQFTFPARVLVVDAGSFLFGGQDVGLATGVATEVIELEDLPGPNDSYTVVLLHMDGVDGSTTFTDSNVGGSAHTWTAAGNAQIDTAQSKFGGASGYFDGSGDYIDTPDHADWAMGSGDFTIDFWFRRDGGLGAHRGFIGNADMGLSDYGFIIRISSDNLMVAIALIGGSSESITGTTAVGDDATWHHVAFVRTGDTLKLFLDGVQEGGDNACSGSMTDSAQPLNVGRVGPATSVWSGWIDEVRVSKGIARWTSNFTPPTEAYSSSGGSVTDDILLEDDSGNIEMEE